jgi:hypothetical protein
MLQIYENVLWFEKTPRFVIEICDEAIVRLSP